MKKIRIIALVLVMALLLGGCVSMEDLMMELGGYTSFSEMSYARTNLNRLQSAVEEVHARIEDGSKLLKLMDAVYDAYDLYNAFNTSYALAQIYYCKDLTDVYWEQEHAYCMENSSQATAWMENMLYALADCPLREALEQPEYFGEGFFDAYEGESMWTEEFVALTEQEAQLVSRYYALQEESAAVPYLSEEFFNTYGKQMAELYVQLVALRQRIAKEAGYEDYASFAFDTYYFRDYTPQQAFDFTQQIAQHLTPIYRKVAYSDVWEDGQQEATEEEVFEYVRSCAQTMGGTAKRAFNLLQRAELYDVSYSENKYDTSFEVFLPSYYQPYVFVSSTNSVRDKLTFAHEFGHFCSDYASYGSIAGIDVAEVFSQGMEYLSLSYAVDGAELQELKMADSLSIYIEQAAYAWFEHRVFALEEEELTVEAIEALHKQMGQKFGMTVWQWDPRSYVCISHFFTNPFYVISYVVSNDAALQIYQREQAEGGAGLKILQENFATEQEYFLSFVEATGLKNPFEEGRIQDVKALFEQVLLK